MEEMVNLFSNVGFPMGITVYLLVRFESKLARLDETMNNLCLSLEKTFLK